MANIRISTRLLNLANRALAESMNVHTMKVLAKNLMPDYDLNKRTGFPESIPIPNRDAANQIVSDIRDKNLFVYFVTLLIEIHQTGLMGRKYRIAFLPEIIKELRELGYIYDQEYKMFVEDPEVRKSINWGVLREDEEYVFTFLRLDIVENSKLVRKYPEELIEATYSALRKIVEKAVEKRNGRIWNWEGDGGLVAFYFSNKNTFAVLSAMEILTELFMYNLMECGLNEPLLVRIAVHTGPTTLKCDFEEIKSDALKKVVAIESGYTSPNSVTISNVVYPTLDEVLASRLKPIKVDTRTNYYSYELKLEN